MTWVDLDADGRPIVNPIPVATRLERAALLIDSAASELLAAAQEGPCRSRWGAELRTTAKALAIWAGTIRGWAGR